MKICTVCEQEKPLEDFDMNRGFRRNQCRQCRNMHRRQRTAQSSEQKQANKDRCKQHYENNKDLYLNYKLKVTYGITLDQYNEMLANQNHVCCICKRPPMGKGKRLYVDHDHTTGEVRGLLCTHCNVMLGMAGENTQVLTAAIKYLEEFKHEPS